jgi:hypothetical protein
VARHGALRRDRFDQREGWHYNLSADERLVDDRDRIPLDDLMDAEPVTADLGRPPVPKRPHVSVCASIGLITGVVALAASLTGVLAPLGLALGLLGTVICLASFAAVRRPHVTGHSLVILGLLTAVAAGVIAGLAMGGQYTWPDADVNEVDRVHTWMNERWSWLERW